MVKYLITLTAPENPYLYKYLTRYSQKFVKFYELSLDAIPEGVEYEMALELTKKMQVHSHTLIESEMSLDEIGIHYYTNTYQLLQSHKPIYKWQLCPDVITPKITSSEKHIQYGYAIRVDIWEDRGIDYLDKKDYKKGSEFAYLCYVKHLYNELWYAQQQTLKDLKDYFNVSTMKQASHQLDSLAEITKNIPNICHTKGLKEITSIIVEERNEIKSVPIAKAKS